MKNFNLKTIGKIILVCCLGIVLTNCEGEDGAIGPDGENGIDGVDGTNGIDGDNGVGFEELTKYGSITFTLEGTRPDDIAFTDTSELKFTQSGTSENNSFYTEENYTEFEFNRLLGIPSGERRQPSLYTYLIINNPGEENQELDLDLAINNYPIISDDLSYFEINENYSKNSQGVSNFSITNYNFNEETNNLVFSFSFDVAAENNDTGHDLKVSGEVNVILFKNIEIPR